MALSVLLSLILGVNNTIIGVLKAAENKEAINKKVVVEAPAADEKTMSKEPTLRNDGETPSSVEPPPDVDLVKDFLGSEVIQILSQPEHVESFQVGPELAEPTVPEKSKLGEFPILKVGPKLSKEQIKKFQSLVLNGSSYNWKVAKRCLFRPETGFLVVKGDSVVEVLLSSWCGMWSFTYKGLEKIEDYDPVQEKVDAFVGILFPNKP